MPRRLRLAGCLLLLASCSAPPARDVVLITLDTTRADHLGCYGRTDAATPTLDALAADGSLFVNAVAAVPITTPAHATILTGLDPFTHGVHDNGTFALPPSATTLAERLVKHGFATRAVVASFALDRRFGLEQGFAAYDDAIRPNRAPDPRAERRAGEVIDRAIAQIRAVPGALFLWVHLYDPHHPYDPPEPWAKRFAEQPYDGEIAYLDFELARLIAALKEQRRWETTLVVVVGDHGEALGDHGERYHGTLTYDATVHVPLLIK